MPWGWGTGAHLFLLPCNARGWHHPLELIGTFKADKGGGIPLHKVLRWPVECASLPSLPLGLGTPWLRWLGKAMRPTPGRATSRWGGAQRPLPVVGASCREGGRGTALPGSLPLGA